MPSALPDGEPVPSDGSLPAHALTGLGERPFGFYLHVPYCASRCGYCDFNTYTATELHASGTVASQETYAANLVGEVRQARTVLGEVELPVQTVFLGGGTPTLLPARDLVAMLAAIREEFGLAPGAEVTTEANPESVTPAYLAELREGGFNRISFGMQSARPHVLKVLDRHHTPGRPEACVAEARAAGFEHVNLDLIYGTPGSPTTTGGPPGRRHRRRPRPRLRLLADRRGGHPAGRPDQARRTADGGRRRARRPLPDRRAGAQRGRLLLVRGLQLGHHRGRPLPPQRALLDRRRLVGRRPRRAQPRRRGALVERQAPGRLRPGHRRGPHPGQGRELLAAEDRRVERILLELRLVDGCPLDLLTATGLKAAEQALADGLLDPGPFAAGRAALTLRGRLLADAVVRDLVD